MKTILLLTLFLLFTWQQSLAGDCVLAQKEYDKGLAAGKSGSWSLAKASLSRSTMECNTFNNWYLLGQVHQQLNENDEAMAAYEDAQKYTKSNNERAFAIGRYAEVQAKIGEITRPLTLIHEARKMHSEPPKWMDDLALNLDSKRVHQPLTIAQVTKGLTNRSIKILNMDIKPSINVNINFKSNSTEVVDDSLSALDVLAKALSEQSVANKQVTILGHADERGSSKFNQDLSERRAKHIKEELINRNPDLVNRLQIYGMGEADPLYKGHSEKDHLFNRRIELQIN